MSSYPGPSGSDNYRQAPTNLPFDTLNQRYDPLDPHYDPLDSLSEYFSQHPGTSEPNIAPLRQHNYSNLRSTPALQHTGSVNEHHNSKTPRVQLSFEQEYETVKSKVDMFADVLTARDNVKTCQVELEARRKIIAENPKKLQNVTVQFTLVSEEYNRLKTQFSGHHDLWISRNVKISDFVFMHSDTWDTGLSNEGLESMIALAKLNLLLLEEYLDLKKLPTRKEQKKAEITTLKKDLDESKSLVPRLEIKIMELEHRAKAAEEEWITQWSEKERPHAKGKPNYAIHHLETRIQTLERENRLLKNPDAWAFDVKSNGLINENNPPLFDATQTTSKHDRRREKQVLEDPQQCKTQVSSPSNVQTVNTIQSYEQLPYSGNIGPNQSSQYPGQKSTSGNTRLYNEHTSNSGNTRPYDEQSSNPGNARPDNAAIYRHQLSMIGGSKPDESSPHKKHHKSGNAAVEHQSPHRHHPRKSGTTTSSFHFGSTLTDCEWIMKGEEGSADKKPWFKESYGQKPEFVWKVLKPCSKRYMDILDWHNFISEQMSASEFKASDFKVNFDNLFKKELVLWTLGWISEEWTPPNDMINFLDVNKRGIKFYDLLEKEFNRINRKQMFEGTPVSLTILLTLCLDTSNGDKRICALI